MSVAITPSLHVRRSRWPRVLGYILLCLLAVVLSIAAYAAWAVQSALPQLDGVMNVSGLKAPVTVARDGHGVPTIHATNFDDLFFAQGYVTAQDRLWQLDVLRRYAAGELSEILGPDLLKHDREQRILGMRLAARKIVELATPQDRANFEAYARGVNAYIQSHQGNLPLEFRILHYLPKPWTPEDSTLIVAHMVKDLNHGQYATALAREKILAKLGPELTADLYVNRSSHDRPPVAETAPPAKPRGSDDDDDDNTPIENRNSVVENFSLSAPGAEDARLVVGSNNWVVSGAHTVSGKPLLSNDMHLGHQMPNIWYEAHLYCGDFNVTGVTLPGLPYVVVGHNQSVAWGFTNVGPTVEDVYVETFNEAGQYKTPAGWKEPEHRKEIIHVKGNPDVVVDIVLTRHGPIISDLVGEKRKIALRWTLQDGVRSPLFLVNAAQNWDQFRRAFSLFDAPGQNVVYADINGNIGYQATGKVPIRANGDGSLPEDGSTDRNEWTGYIPYEQMPSVFNPASGIIATANSRIIPDRYRYSISDEWEAPWRSERIYRVLESGKKFTSADMLALQTDTYSAMDHFTAQQLVLAVDHMKGASSARAKQAAEIMRSWDGRMSADSAAPAVEYRARQQLVSLLLGGKLGPAFADYHYSWGMQSVWLENVLRERPVRWLSEKYPDYDELLNAALEAAVSEPTTPKELNSWKWGGMNSIEIQHPIFGKVPFLRRWSGTGVNPQSGSGYAVKAVTSSHGPSERFTADLANLDASTLNTVTGQSGNLFSPYYLDQWKAWYGGTTFNLPFSIRAVQTSAEHRLVLQPGK